MTQRDPRIKNDRHLSFIRQLPCLVCRERTYTEEAAHIRMADARHNKRACTGMQRKPDDFYAVPLCGQHHRDQHAMNEREFWDMAGIDPIEKALALYLVKGNHALGTKIILGR